MAVAPFSIAIPTTQIADLRRRLRDTRWPDQVAGGWDYGVDLGYLRELAGYWADGYDWAARQAQLNELPQFRAVIDGVGVHFLHARGNGPTPMPLVLLHGWPSSFLQMLPILPLLTDPAEAFDVVVPSLPGYGFSDRPAEPGMSVGRAGELIHRLLTDELGYRRYGLRASDLGAGVASVIALAHPQAVIGLHLSATNPFLPEIPGDLTRAEQRFVARVQAWRQSEMAYAMVHATKPQTLAVGLNDSPAGLAAWILEKFRAWSDCGGDVEQAFHRDDLLTNLTIYWATQTIGSSIRIYHESRRTGAGRPRPDVATAVVMLPADLFPTPREWVERWSRVDRWTELPRGGHFAEWEVPDLLAEDIRGFSARSARPHDHRPGKRPTGTWSSRPVTPSNPEDGNAA
jgi:pimeloyl-ACP methyl ester carboxylesterase